MPDSAPLQTEVRPPRQRGRHVGLIILSVIVLALVALVLLGNWDWFIPVVQSRATAAIGRRVTITHLHVKLGRVTTMTADGVTLANPDGFPQQKPLAHFDSLTVAANVMSYFHGRAIVLPLIAIDHPDIAATALPDGSNNFILTFPAGSASSQRAANPPQIGDLRIEGGTAHVVDPKFRANFTLAIATRDATASGPAALVADATGTYAGAPITGQFTGGALLSLRDAARPYPLRIRIANGQTRVAVDGTVLNPLNFAGAEVTLKVSGTDMSALFPLTGIPIPPTPPFSIAGNLDYARPKIRLTNFTGRVGSSDINGDIEEDLGIGGKPDVTLNLWSRQVDLTDLGGFIGTAPGRKATPGQTAAQKQVLAQTEARKTPLPNTPINLPKLRAANVHLKYRGAHIENRYTPFDNIEAVLDVVDGRISIHPVSLAVGEGRVLGNIDLVPGERDIIQARADIKFQHIDLSRVLRATKTFKGQGIIGGEARIDADGNSLASMLSQGNGEAKLILLGGGNLSALLVDLSGLQFGNALLSALGVPERATIQCFVTDLPLRQGVATTKVFLLDTDEGRITGDGSIDFRDQTLQYSLTTRSKHFSVGSLPGPINIIGPLGSPSIRPGAEVVARAGASTGLGILLTPLGALLPTIQFGVGDDNACTRATVAEKQPLKMPVSARRRVHK
jgi:AsmA family protein